MRGRDIKLLNKSLKIKCFLGFVFFVIKDEIIFSYIFNWSVLIASY